jgi:hypothetical protein
VPCTGGRYQFKKVEKKDKFLCVFYAENISCSYTWQTKDQIIFTDSCKFFGLSQIVDYSRIQKYR